MFTKKALIAAVGLLAVSANAERKITPKTPELVDGCYQISSAEELYEAAFYIWGDSKCLKLTDDIVVNKNVIKNGALNVADTANFAIWGSAFSSFKGVFDGQGHTISGLYFNDSTRSNIGLFGHASGSISGADGNIVIKDVHLVDTYFKGKQGVAGLVGDVDEINLVIERSSVEGVIEGNGSVGGLVGSIYKAESVSIYNSYNEASVNARSTAGGIVGFANWDSGLRIANTYNIGAISGQGNTGGIIGTADYTMNRLELINVFNVGPVAATKEDAEHVNSIGYLEIHSRDSCVLDNVFYLGPEDGSNGGSMTKEQFSNGTVALLMHDYNYDGVDGSIWGQNVGTDSLPTFSGVITGAVTLPSITLSLDTGGAELWTREIPSGFRHRIPDVQRESYVLFGWYDNAALTGEKVTHVPATQTENVKFWGHYEPIYKITLQTNGGTIPSLNVDSYIHTVGAKLPYALLLNGYIFEGWYASADFSGNAVDSVTTTDEGDKIFYAKWIKEREPQKNSEGCYVISDAGELFGFATLVNGTETILPERTACAVLENDIVVNKNVLNGAGEINKSVMDEFVQWTPIDSFAGTFDGQMHTISGLYFVDTLNAQKRKHVGFIASMGGSKKKPAVVKNVGIVDSYFASGSTVVGAVVGSIVDARKNSVGLNYGVFAEIRNSYNTSTVRGADGNVFSGGLFGDSGDDESNLIVENCYNLGRVTSKRNAAGLVGSDDANEIIVVNSYNAGTIGGEGWSNLVLKNCDDCDGDNVKIKNSYRLKASSSKTFNGEFGGYTVSAELFANGSVALALHDGENGSVWGQNVGTDEFPVLSGKVENSDAVIYNVTFHTYEGDTATYYDHYVAGLQKKLPDVVPMKDMVLEGWYKTADFSDSREWYISTYDEGDLEFYAKFEPRPCTVRVDVAGDGFGLVNGLTGNKEEATYPQGTELTLEAVPYECDYGDCYYFSYWEDDVANTNPVRKVKIISDTTFIAHFGVGPSSSSFVPSSNSVESSSSSAKLSSSSSVPRSSSSIKSSSSVKSSSSKSKSSSSVKSSSSAKSSSSGKSSSSSKKGKDALPTVASVAPQFSVEVVGRDIRVSGAIDADAYALLDMQGRVLRSGPAFGANLAIPVDHAGTFFVRVGNGMRCVSVK